ncbi:terminase large subunit [Dorea acetigenes]|uniref:Terminase large subunit n=1 Tax=Dorea acetigenes TaxID=2981787 RepID=A0ABT2RIU9_9FIRM|nr:terminase large subunit [Dorea acetigenes]MCU6685325.1 terminase large subunit [Dorea acetigenes]SCI43844.1 Phage terminase-like protein%2C large subunit [uncultured Clostridium sp.]
MAELRRGRQTPTQSVVIPYSDTKGPDAIKLYKKTGNELLEWQQLIACDIMAVNKEGLWVHQKYGYSVPRRNGKSENVLSRCLWGLKNKERILYTAHRATTSHAVWERLSRMCGKADIHISSSFKAFGKEHLYTSDGGVIEFRTRTSNGGLGEGYDLLIIDEAQEYTEAQETSLKYVVSDSKNPQTIMLGTPPTVVSAGTVFVKYRETVLSGRGFDSGWAEWSVSEQHRPDDVEAWYETNPSLGTILTERKIRAEITTDDIDFNIQRLGLWLRYNQKSEISKAEWEALAVKAMPELKGKLFVGIKYGHDGENVAMSVAVKTKEGKIFVESIDCRPTRAGNRWILENLAAMDYKTVVIDGANGQQLLADQMKEIGLKNPVLPTVKQIIVANSSFEQGLFQNNIRHNNQPSLVRAVSNCEKRAIGTNGGFGYRSIKEGVEIALMESVILAYWQCAESKEKKKQRSSY